MQTSSAGILMKSLKKNQTPKRPFWLTLAPTADRQAVFALLSGPAPPGAGLWRNSTVELITGRSAEHLLPSIPGTWCFIDYSCMLNKVHPK